GATSVGDPDATVVCLSHMYDLCLLTLPCPDTPDWEPLGLTPVWRWKAHVLKLPTRRWGLACFLEHPVDAGIERARELRLALGRRCCQFRVEPDHVVVSHAVPFRTSCSASSAARGCAERWTEPASQCCSASRHRTESYRRSRWQRHQRHRSQRY